MSPAEALERLVAAIDANAAKTGGNDLSGYIRLDWVAADLANARRVLAEESVSR